MPKFEYATSGSLVVEEKQYKYRLSINDKVHVVPFILIGQPDNESWRFFVDLKSVDKGEIPNAKDLGSYPSSNQVYDSERIAIQGAITFIEDIYNVEKQ